MRFAKTIGAALLVGSTALAFTGQANAAPMLGNQAVISSGAPTLTESVQYYYRRYGYRGYPRYGYGYRGYGYDGAAVVGGLAAGAIIGGAIAAGQANAAAQQHAAYCSQRYRSYDPASNTYLSKDGNRYPCR
ncbi:MAG: hypothetical protein BGP05_10965 [Rhizobiales bacterium 62-47]|nr:BA14K family protein [Hyphomicrobiales bacterium]OJY12325.1 MAG: hypothetical protein BGP05_10965 [Rhizobiales bacterium 62-47]